jgi:hypothetical protein
MYSDMFKFSGLILYKIDYHLDLSRENTVSSMDTINKNKSNNTNNS